MIGRVAVQASKLGKTNIKTRTISARPGVNCVRVRKVKGKKGVIREQHDLIVNIDLDFWSLTKEQVADLKEVFMLFDKDEDGLLTLEELEQVMQALGQRPAVSELLVMVRDVSEDQTYSTIEFNEFLQMMSKQMHKDIAPKDLIEAFRNLVLLRVVGLLLLVVADLPCQLVQEPLDTAPAFSPSFSSALLTKVESWTEIEQFLKMAGPVKEGLIDYKEFCFRLLMPAMPRPEENVRNKPGELQTNQDLSQPREQEA